MRRSASRICSAVSIRIRPQIDADGNLAAEDADVADIVWRLKSISISGAPGRRPVRSRRARSTDVICVICGPILCVRLRLTCGESSTRGTLGPMGAFVNVNGKITDGEHATISIFDHGFLYGEGVYETLRTYNGEPFFFDRHMNRLRTSARMIMLDVPFGDAEFLRRSVETMTAAHLGQRGADGTAEAYIRILLTRGIGELTYDPAATPVPSVVVIVKPLAVTRGARFRERRQGVHGRHHPQPSAVGEPDHQEQQFAEQRALHAAGDA